MLLPLDREDDLEECKLEDTFNGTFTGILRGILLLGGVLSVLWYGIRRIYNGAKSIEEVLALVKSAKTDREEEAAKRLELNRTLCSHIADEEERDRSRALAFQELADNVRDIAREIRPNGGSSMKDQLTALTERQNDLRVDVAALKQWKDDESN